MTTKLEVAIDNRGGEVPFGYVYVGNTRIGFHTDLNGNRKVWATRPEGYWPTPTDREFSAAKQALKGAGFGEYHRS